MRRAATVGGIGILAAAGIALGAVVVASYLASLLAVAGVLWVARL